MFLHPDPHLLVCCFLLQMLSRCVFFLWTLALFSLLPHFAPVVLSLVAGLCFPPSSSKSLHFCSTGCCLLPAFDSLPIPSLSLARTALRCLPFWLILPPTPSHGFSSLPRSRLPTCRNSSYLNQWGGSWRGDLIQCWCCVSMYVPSLGTDLITSVLPQYATITPRIL